MNGVHDLGGMHGFGPVDRQESVRFEHDWEPVVVAMQSAMDGPVSSIDEFRYAIERMDPVHYLGSTYFEHWLESMVTTCLEKGIIRASELHERELAFRAGASAELAAAARWPARPRPGHPFRRTSGDSPRFRHGDSVRTRNLHPAGHTRLPRYARGRRGTLDTYRGCFVFPDTNAVGAGESPGHVWSVGFTSEELWGESAEPGVSIHLDLFECYLEEEV